MKLNLKRLYKRIKDYQRKSARKRVVNKGLLSKIAESRVIT